MALPRYYDSISSKCCKDDVIYFPSIVMLSFKKLWAVVIREGADLGVSPSIIYKAVTIIIGLVN